MLKKQFKYLIVALGFALPLVTFAQQDYYLNLIEKGNNLYQNGFYDSAFSAYVEVETAGLQSFNLYYNLGNTAFKLNNLPTAILYYEKAAKINPQNPDLQHNLAQANAQIVDKIESIPPFFITTAIKDAAYFFTATQWAWVNIFWFLVAIIAIAGYLRIKKINLKVYSFYLAILALLLWSSSLYFGFKKYHLETNSNQAIIFQPSLTVKSEPSLNSTDLFVVHQGTKITILEQADTWCKISLADGNVGWVKTDTFQKI